MAYAARSFRHSSTVRGVRFWNGKYGRGPRPLAGSCTMKYRADIDGLQALAINRVLFYHVGDAGRLTAQGSIEVERRLAPLFVRNLARAGDASN